MPRCEADAISFTPEGVATREEQDMAIADQTTAAAMARQFADLLADEPAVERIWYLAEPPRAPWASVSLTIWIQLDNIDDDIKREIDAVTERVLGGREDIQLGLYLFLLDALPDRNLEEALDPEEAIEIQMRRA
jgi:hypothetical protein